MLSPIVRPPGLVTGARMELEEFLRRWEELPDLKNVFPGRWPDGEAFWKDDGLASEDRQHFIERLAAPK